MDIKHILILEDDEKLARLYQQYLWEEFFNGIVPTITDTVHSAIASAKKMADGGTPFYVAILDYSIWNDNQTGNDAARIIKTLSPTTRIVGNTGGNPLLFDRQFVDKVMCRKIRTATGMLLAIRDNNLGGMP